jgi:hypothetical protein
MNLFERLDRVRHVLVASGHDEDPRDTGIYLNRRLFEKPLDSRDGMMAQRAQQNAMYQQGLGAPEPVPTKKWIAVAGRFWKDGDTADEAIYELEASVMKVVRSGLDAKIGNYRHALEKAEKTAQTIGAIVDGVPSGSGEP